MRRKKKFVNCVKCDIITHATAIIVSQPFHVITVRMMAQFVGRETKYVYVSTVLYGSRYNE